MYGPEYLRKLAVMEESRKPDLETVERKTQFMQSACKNTVDQFGNGVQRLPLDGYDPANLDKKAYKCITEEGMQKFLDYDWTNKREYIKQTYDCEQFALSFVTHLSEQYNINNVGVVIDYSSAHAYVAWVPPRSDPPALKVIEPQNDNIMDPGANDMHKLERGYILL